MFSAVPNGHLDASHDVTHIASHNSPTSSFTLLFLYFTFYVQKEMYAVDGGNTMCLVDCKNSHSDSVESIRMNITDTNWLPSTGFTLPASTPISEVRLLRFSSTLFQPGSFSRCLGFISDSLRLDFALFARWMNCSV